MQAAHALLPLLTGSRKLLLFGAKRLMTQLAPWDVRITAPFDDDQIMQYLLAPQSGKYEAPEHARALYARTLADAAALEEQGMTPLYRNIELPLLNTLYAMECEGFLVDKAELERLGSQYNAQLDALREEIYALCRCAAL